jgi:hypothetical protein
LRDEGFHKRIWRAAIGLIAVYALVLQATLALNLMSQATAQEASADSPFSIICVSHDQGAVQDGAAGSDAPARSNAHCPLCPVAVSAAATVPEPVLLPARPFSLAGAPLFVSVEACLSFHRARVGLSRAPPQSV